MEDTVDENANPCTNKHQGTYSTGLNGRKSTVNDSAHHTTIPITTMGEFFEVSSYQNETSGEKPNTSAEDCRATTDIDLDTQAIDMVEHGRREENTSIEESWWSFSKG